MLIATWNVNSLRARIDRVLAFLETHQPDVLCIQETKVAPDKFPHMEIQAAGYRAIDYSGGQWAGVAILVRDGVPIGDDILQLASPLAPDSPLMRFIERKGEGFYNLALEVDDLDAALAELAERGIKVSEPIEAMPGVRSSFITMAATHGLSIQLVELTQDSGGEQLLDLTPDEWTDEA